MQVFFYKYVVHAEITLRSVLKACPEPRTTYNFFPSFIGVLDVLVPLTNMYLMVLKEDISSNRLPQSQIRSCVSEICLAQRVEDFHVT